MSFIDEFIYRRGILLNSFVDPKEEELDTDDLEVALINESFEEQIKQSQLLYSSDIKSLFYNGGQTTLLNNDQMHSHKHKDSIDSSLLIKIVPTCSPIRLPHITPNSDFDDSERGRQLDMELGRMMLEGDDENESTFMNSLDDSGSKLAFTTKYLDKSYGDSYDETEEAEDIVDNNNEFISKKLPPSLKSASILEQMANINTTSTTKTPISYYNISSLTFLPYHHMAGGFFSSSSFESTISQQEDDDQQSACADAAEAIAIDVVQSLFADDEQYSHSELGATDDEAEEDYEEDNNMAIKCFSNSSSSSSQNNSFSSCSSFCQINKTN